MKINFKEVCMKTKNHAAPGSTAFKTALALFTGILLFAACEDTTKPSDLTPPAEVSGLSAVPGDGQAVLTWTDPADEDFDHVEIAFAPAAAGIEQPITVAKGTQSRAVTGLANGTTYTFTVKTVDATGNRSAGVNAPAIPDATTGDDTTPPAEVSGLNAAPGEGQIVLTWTGPADEDFDHVEIDFTPAATGLEQPITVVRGVQRRIITGLANETYYTFTVKTVDAAGNQSAGVNATAAPIAPVLTSSIAELAVYLLGVAGGSSADNPVPLKAALNLTSDWANLLGAIETADKYVSLDLTTCAMTNMSYVAGEFNPRGANTGERLITSLTLPAVATSIYFGTVSSPTFRYFTNLKNVKGSAVTTRQFYFL
jgi:chitodextrinase